MRWRGALLGFAVGAALGGLLILVPRARQGSFYEVGDPLLVMGLPLLVVGTAVGAMVDAALGRRFGAGAGSSRSSGLVGIAIGLVAILLAGVWFLWGTGILIGIG